MPIDTREPARNYQVPAAGNTVAEEFERLILAITSIGSDMAAVMADVAGKAASVHTHTIAQVSGLQGALDSKLESIPAIALNDLTDVNVTGASDLQVLMRVAGSWQPAVVDWANLSGKPSSFTPAAHNHAASEITSGKFADARMPERLDADAAQATDWNNVHTPGFYWSQRGTDGALNNPDGGAGTKWWMGYVLTYGGSWTRQIVWRIDGTASDTECWMRTYNSGTTTWNAWARVRMTETELATVFATLAGAAFTGAVTIQTDSGSIPLTLTRYGGAANQVQRRANGTSGAPTAVAVNDILGGLNASGWDGSAFVIGGQLRPVVRGVAAGRITTAWTLGTMNAAGTLADRLELTEEGDLHVADRYMALSYSAGYGRVSVRSSLGNSFTTRLAIPPSGDGLWHDGTTWQALVHAGNVGSYSAAPLKGTALDDQTFNSSGTWTKPGSGTWAFVEMWGAGQGGGRDASGQNRLGGEGGEYIAFWVPFVALPASATATIGAGGAGKTSNGNSVAGDPGGNTSFLGITARGGRIEDWRDNGDTHRYRRNGSNAPIAAYGQGYVSEPGASCILDPTTALGGSVGYILTHSSDGSMVTSILRDIDARTGRLSPGAQAGPSGGRSLFGITDRGYGNATSYGAPGNTINSGGSGGGFNNSNTAIPASTSTNGGSGGAGGAAGGGTAGTAPGGGGGAGTNANGGAGAAGRVRVRVY